MYCVKKLRNRYHWLISFLLFLVGITMHVHRAAFNTGLVAILTKPNDNSTVMYAPNWNENDQGVLLSAFFYGNVAFQIPAGYIASRIGGRIGLTIALGGSSAMELLVHVCVIKSKSIYALFVSRVISGVAQAFTFPSAILMVSNWAPLNARSRMTSFFLGGNRMGAVLGSILAGTLSSSALKWQSVFYTTGTFGMLYCITWIALSANHPEK